MFVRMSRKNEAETDPWVVANFWLHVEKTDSCWLWRGALGNNGYGSYQWKRNAKDIRVHRMSFRYLIGPIPKGMLVCHKCDVRHCVRPDHLFLGTATENLQDMVVKGRFLGESKYNALLTEDDVRFIRQNKHLGIKRLSTVLDKKYSTVSNVYYNRGWKHVV
jgi:HNH endonuclease